MSNNNNNNTAAQLEAALEYTRQSIVDCVREGETRRVAHAYEKLEAAGWNLKAAFPINYNSYQCKAQKEANAFAKSYTASAEGSRPSYMPNAPEPRQALSAEAIQAKAQAAGERHAEATLKSYAAKLAKKIEGFAAGQEITGLVYTGGANVWGHSFVKVQLANGAVLNVKTQMIVNVSGLGTVFNQFPTRLVK